MSSKFPLRCRVIKAGVKRRRCVLENARRLRLYEAELKKGRKK